MLREKALKKIFITTLSMFIILTVYTIPSTINHNNVLRTNLEIEDITRLNTDKIYLLNKNNFLVKADIFIDSNQLEEKIEKIINYLIQDNDKVPVGLNGYIPKHTKLLGMQIDGETLKLNFSKEFLNYEKEEEKTIITGIVYSLLELDEIQNVIILVDEQYIKGYTKPLDKELGINNKYLFYNRSNISKVVVYYLDDTSTYYVPVTKYLNDSREKIEVIVDELNNIAVGDELISLLNNNIQLYDYREEENVLFLNFNEYLLDKSEDINNKIMNEIAYSVFDNYDVNMVVFQVDNHEIKYFNR